MPESALWSLVVGLALLAFGLTCKIANISHRLKGTDDEALRWKRKFQSLQDAYDEKISDLKKLHQTEIDEFHKKNEELELAPWQVEHDGPVIVDD